MHKQTHYDKGTVCMTLPNFTNKAAKTAEKNLNRTQQQKHLVVEAWMNKCSYSYMSENCFENMSRITGGGPATPEKDQY